MKPLSLFVLSLVLMGLTPNASEAGTGYSVSLETFFAGSSYSAGTTHTLFSRDQPFTAEFSGVAADGHLQLDERFAFPDGARLQQWDLKRDGPTRYTGTVRTETGDGILREPRPVDGRISGSRVVLSYVGYAPGRGAVLFHFRHAMQVQANGIIRNRVTVWKLGVPLAWADVTFAKTKAALASLQGAIATQP